MEAIFELSWQTQIILVSGYLSYLIAYSGRRDAHKAIDTVLLILVFGSPALFVLGFSDGFEKISEIWAPYLAGTLSVLASLSVGAIWRRRARDFFSKGVGWISRNEDDGLPTAWQTVIQTEGLLYTQINVTLKNGRTLESYELGHFNTLPNGPCVLGGDGSIAIYATHITDDLGERREAKNLEDEQYGARLTYIPADQIAEIDLRRKTK